MRTTLHFSCLTLPILPRTDGVPPGVGFVTTGLRADDLRTRALPADAFGSRPFLPATSIVKVNPRASMAYLLREEATGNPLGATRLHSSFGTGIRAANGFELAFTNNSSLKPECQFQVGHQAGFLSDRAVLDATYFWQLATRLCFWERSLANLSTFTSEIWATRARVWNCRSGPATRSPLGSKLNTRFARYFNPGIENTNVALCLHSRWAQPLVRRPRLRFLQTLTHQQRGRLMLNTDGVSSRPRAGP